jgi:undecaprenyl phosphate N,N'-diacetylbacillosamine 1-phosphate transferase
MRHLYNHFLKRLLDMVLSFAAIVVFSPVMLLVGLALAWVNRGKVFFLQERPGLNERSFTIIKFKSMNDKRDALGNLLPDNQRLTRVGAFIRKTSLDELPQLFNVLIGKMSIVGPRPLLVRYLPLYSQEQRKRHQVRPGITGWAQVNGRNSLTWTEKFEHDLYYVHNCSIELDALIIWKTILKVIKREGINQGADRPMPPFTGNN